MPARLHASEPTRHVSARWHAHTPAGGRVGVNSDLRERMAKLPVGMPAGRSAHMQTIGVLSQKGGAGKTTLSVHLAVAAQQEGYRVAIIDLDPQATARKWGDKRQEAEPEEVGDHAERLPQLAEAARANGADLLIIDTAPNADRASLAAARLADL